MAAGRLAEEHGFFHWELEFPGVYYDEHGQRKGNVGVEISESMGGFDAVIGNPPWERVQVSDDDFFRPIYLRETGNSWNVLSKLDKEKFKTKILQNPKTRRTYTNAKNYVNSLNSYFTRYSIQGGGPTELFKLFTERSLCLLNKKSSFGMIVPSAIYSDISCAQLRKIIFRQTSIQHISSFINT